MTKQEAVRLIAVLASYFRQEVTEETAVLWSKELADFDLYDGLEAAELAGKTQIFMPTLAAFLGFIRDVRNTRMLAERLELPPDIPPCCIGEGFGHFYRDHADPDIKARVDKLLSKSIDRRKDTAILEAFAAMVGGKL